MITHYHVVVFIDGCLNDYDSGPIEDIAEAREALAWQLDLGRGAVCGWKRTGEDRYQQIDGLYIVKIEDCTEGCNEWEDDYDGLDPT